jgi:cysteine desulfurase
LEGDVRVYLDHNATTPLRAEARAAMLAAMDVAGNPSSVHAEGRAAKMMVEKARGQVAALVGCDVSEVIFTSGATEAIAGVVQDAGNVVGAAVEHEAVRIWCPEAEQLPVGRNGHVDLNALPDGALAGKTLFLQRANSETGVLQPESLLAELARLGASPASVFRDAVQAAGKLSDLGRWRSDVGRHASLAVSAHKLGGPKGIGALIAGPEYTPGLMQPMLRGGGQELGRRAGTENVIGIAGFGAACAAAAQDLADGVWERVAELRNVLEKALEAASKKTIFVGKDVARLPNTSCFITPGWCGETQVMQMDLAGFAISAGSACSSGKVATSRVLTAMGFDDAEASCAVRVSLGPDTTEEQVLRFADAWTAKLKKHEARAA